MPAAHPRRSTFAIHVNVFLSRGIKPGRVSVKDSPSCPIPSGKLERTLRNSKQFPRKHSAKSMPGTASAIRRRPELRKCKTGLRLRLRRHRGRKSLIGREIPTARPPPERHFVSSRHQALSSLDKIRLQLQGASLLFRGLRPFPLPEIGDFQTPSSGGDDCSGKTAGLFILSRLTS